MTTNRDDYFTEPVEGIRIVKRAEKAPAPVVPLTKRDARLAARQRQRDARAARRNRGG